MPLCQICDCDAVPSFAVPVAGMRRSLVSLRPYAHASARQHAHCPQVHSALEHGADGPAPSLLRNLRGFKRFYRLTDFEIKRHEIHSFIHRLRSRRKDWTKLLKSKRDHLILLIHLLNQLSLQIKQEMKRMLLTATGQ